MTHVPTIFLFILCQPAPIDTMMSLTPPSSLVHLYRSSSSSHISSSSRRFFPTRCSLRDKMSSNSPPSHPDSSIVLGCGMVAVDFLATVASYPKPDDKIRSTSMKVEGGGNSGNALTCAARLGLKPRLISKVANDYQGTGILEELEADGVDTSYIVVSEEGNSPFSYLIVDNQTKTRTCIHTPGHPLLPADLSESTILSAIDGAKIVYFDGRFPETALLIAQAAVRKNMPVLVEAERIREGLDDLLRLADYAICSTKFPKAWTKAPSTVRSIVSILLRLPKLKFVIVTLGEDGCIMLERCVNDASDSEELDVDRLLESLKQGIGQNTEIPTCVSSRTAKLTAKDIGTVTGRLILGTAEKIPPSELIDTTGAGDAFIGAVLYALCAGMPPERMLPFASQVAACCCRALGARGGLPYHNDPRLASVMH